MAGVTGCCSSCSCCCCCGPCCGNGRRSDRNEGNDDENVKVEGGTGEKEEASSRTKEGMPSGNEETFSETIAASFEDLASSMVNPGLPDL